MRTVLRAWAYSVLTCIGAVAVFASVMQARTGRFDHMWHNVTDVTAAFSVVFGIVAALVLIPSFLLLRRVPRIPTDRRLMAVLGAMAAPITFMTLRMAFAEWEDPGTAWGWIRHWMRHPAELVVGSFPFLIPGAVFGSAWSAGPRRLRSRPPQACTPGAS